jgi:thiamine-phosphate pyrophosphorylase
VTICLVTDRRRLLPADAPLDAARRGLLAQARYAVDAGVDLIQIRERDLEAAALSALIADLLALTRGSATRVVVNDRVDVAIACGADGVHLRGDSIPVAAARRLAPTPFLVGRSVHAVGDVDNVDSDAAGADVVVAGSVFASRSKPVSHGCLGVDGLRAIVSATDAPVLAIGGVTSDRFDAIAATGAAGLAAIGLFMGDRGPIPLDSVVRHARLAFDRVRRGP